VGDRPEILSPIREMEKPIREKIAWGMMLGFPAFILVGLIVALFLVSDANAYVGSPDPVIQTPDYFPTEWEYMTGGAAIPSPSESNALMPAEMISSGPIGASVEAGTTATTFFQAAGAFGIGISIGTGLNHWLHISCAISGGCDGGASSTNGGTVGAWTFTGFRYEDTTQCFSASIVCSAHNKTYIATFSHTSDCSTPYDGSGSNVYSWMSTSYGYSWPGLEACVANTMAAVYAAIATQISEGMCTIEQSSPTKNYGVCVASEAQFGKFLQVDTQGNTGDHPTDHSITAPATPSTCDSNCTALQGAMVTAPSPAKVDLAKDLDPAYEGEGFTLPQPSPNETSADWEAGLDPLYTGTITEVDLTDATGVPEMGPSAVARIQLTPSNTVYDPLNWPSGGVGIVYAQNMTVYVNPSDYAPVSTATQGNCESCAIDWGPISSISFGTKFPFGLFSWVNSLFGSIPDSGTCPTLSIAKPSAIGGGTQDISFCSSLWEDTWRPIVFSFLEAFMTAAGIIFLAKKILGYGGSDED
jgi:hypothetical protein